MIFGVLVFEDNRTEDVIVYRPRENGLHEFFTASGLYIYLEKEKTFYKYEPGYTTIELSMSGGYDHNDRSCYFVDRTVMHAELHASWGMVMLLNS